MSRKVSLNHSHDSNKLKPSVALINVPRRPIDVLVTQGALIKILWCEERQIYIRNKENIFEYS